MISDATSSLQGYWTIVPYQILIQVLKAINKQDELCLSPPGVIEQ